MLCADWRSLDRKEEKRANMEIIAALGDNKICLALFFALVVTCGQILVGIVDSEQAYIDLTQPVSETMLQTLLNVSVNLGIMISLLLVFCAVVFLFCILIKRVTGD